MTVAALPRMLPWGMACSLGCDCDAGVIVGEGVRSNELDAFLSSIERQAYRIAWHHTNNHADALDLVQDAMMRLARVYASRAVDDWRPLFFGILRNRIRDWQRHEKIRNRVFFWRRGSTSDGDEPEDPIEQAVDVADAGPEREAIAHGALHALEAALKQLPARQREAFLLRTLDGMDLRATAAAMGVSEGSVKTHYSRAVHRLRAMLGAHWDE